VSFIPHCTPWAAFVLRFHTGNVIGGYKATLSNPNTSEEAKQHAQEVIDNYESSGEVPEPKSTSHSDDKNTGNVIGEPIFDGFLPHNANDSSSRRPQGYAQEPERL
jgi:hypothetical protein